MHRLMIALAALVCSGLLAAAVTQLVLPAVGLGGTPGPTHSSGYGQGVKGQGTKLVLNPTVPVGAQHLPFLGASPSPSPIATRGHSAAPHVRFSPVTRSSPRTPVPATTHAQVPATTAPAPAPSTTTAPAPVVTTAPPPTPVPDPTTASPTQAETSPPAPQTVVTTPATVEQTGVVTPQSGSTSS